MTSPLDAVVIGSGLGGLTCAAFLARAGKRVLVLEQHTVPGGYAHGFQRGRYHFDSAIHYVGGAGADGIIGTLLGQLGVDSEVSFLPMDPQGFDRLHFPDFEFAVPAGAAAYEDRLCERFPHQRRGIRGVLAVLNNVWKEARRYEVPRGLLDLATLPVRYPSVARWSFSTWGSLLNRHITDDKLRAVLSAQAINYGEPPSRASLLVHTSMLMSYLDGGAFYPAGGTQSLANALVKAIERHGGQVRVRASVKRIRIENKKARGVELADGEVIESRQVVSNADLWKTLGELVPAEQLPSSLQRSVQKRVPSCSALSLYLATSLNLPGLGIGTENHLLFHHWDPERIDFGAALTGGPDHALGPMLVSSPSTKDPSGQHAPSPHHVLECLALIPYEPFAAWKDTRLRHRGNDYAALKAAVTDRMLQTVEERLLPGLSTHRVQLELGTPLTCVHYDRVTRGAIYGPALIPRQVGLRILGPRLPIQDLWLAGSNGGMFFGAVGSMFGGFQSATAILGRV